MTRRDWLALGLPAAAIGQAGGEDTAKYQDALELGKLASRTRDFAAMDKWLAQFGEPTAA